MSTWTVCQKWVFLLFSLCWLDIFFYPVQMNAFPFVLVCWISARLLKLHDIFYELVKCDRQLWMFRLSCFLFSGQWLLITLLVPVWWIKIKIKTTMHPTMCSPHRRFFVLHLPLLPGNSGLFPYIAPKNLAFKTPPPPSNFQWPSMGWVWIIHFWNYTIWHEINHLKTDYFQYSTCLLTSW